MKYMKGLELVEVMIIIAIVAICVALVVPFYTDGKQGTARASIVNAAVQSRGNLNHITGAGNVKIYEYIASDGRKCIVADGSGTGISCK